MPKRPIEPTGAQLAKAGPHAKEMIQAFALKNKVYQDQMKAIADAAPDDSGASFKDLGGMETRVGSAWDDLPGAKDIAPEMAGTLKSAATHIAAEPKNNMTALEGIKFASELTNVDPKTGEVGFKATPSKNGAQVTLPNGRTAFVPKDTFQQLAIIAGQKAQQIKAKGKQDAAVAGRSQDVMDALGNSFTSGHYPNMKDLQDARDKEDAAGAQVRQNVWDGVKSVGSAIANTNWWHSR
jgi:hypothetical protein